MDETTGLPRVRKIGEVLWEEGEYGRMKPKDLASASESDAINLNRVYEAMVTYRKVRPILHIVQTTRWDNFRAFKHFLRESLDLRAEARAMRMTDDWDTFWNSLY
jgi:hypothetical protein